VLPKAMQMMLMQAVRAALGSVFLAGEMSLDISSSSLGGTKAAKAFDDRTFCRWSMEALCVKEEAFTMAWRAERKPARSLVSMPRTALLQASSSVPCGVLVSIVNVAAAGLCEEDAPLWRAEGGGGMICLELLMVEAIGDLFT
jgi:hypothetical protein